MDDAQYDECDDEYVTEGIEYIISPDKSSLGLIKSVDDFTDRSKIFATMFMAMPKAKYRSEFIPRKFAFPNPEIKNQPTTDDIVATPYDKLEKQIQVKNSDKLSSSSRARHVPSSRVSRVANFSALGIGLGLGTVAEASRRIVGLGNQTDSSGIKGAILSEVITLTCLAIGNQKKLFSIF